MCKTNLELISFIVLTQVTLAGIQTCLCVCVLACVSVKLELGLPVSQMDSEVTGIPPIHILAVLLSRILSLNSFDF